MSRRRDLLYTISEAELRPGEDALEIGNVGKARVCARRACMFVISAWSEDYEEFDWGNNAMSFLEGVRDESLMPDEIREAANRLTVKVNQNFSTGFEENPIEDARLIITYFLSYYKH